MNMFRRPLRMFLKRGMSTNFLITLLTSGLPLITTLVTVPIYISAIGTERYGVIALLLLLFGYLGLLDLGLSRATTFRLSQLQSADRADYLAVYRTSIALNLALGMVLGSLFYFGAEVFLRYRDTGQWFVSEMADAIVPIAILFPFTLASNACIGRLEAEQRFATLAAIGLPGAVLVQVAPIIFVHLFGVSIATAVYGIVAARSINVAAFLIVHVVHDWHVESRRRFSRQEAGNLLRYGAWVSVSNIASPLLVSADQFVLGYVAGPKSVAFYNLGFNLASKLLLLPGALAKVTFPRMVAASPENLDQLANMSVRATAWMLFPLVSVAIAGASPFFTHWISAEFAVEASATAQLLLAGVWINSSAYVAVNILMARGQTSWIAKLHFAELVPFIAVLWLCVSVIGVEGAAIAWSLRVTIDAILMFYLAGMAKSVAKTLALPFCLIWLQVLYHLTVDVSAWVDVGFVLAALVVSGLGAFSTFQSVKASPVLAATG
ncbi:oligosaccharide flippase family protein [Aureimonas phyllosphaerae]|uniref:oligosaccharide flippase family protein n=1 Tax=Aureimonas phyllosphaerae TaxID=1166078 RepID=UPI003A5BF790